MSQTPGSRWWYLVVAVPLYYVFATVVGFAVSLFAFVAAVSSAGEPGPGLGPALGLGFVGVVGVVLLLVALGILLSLVFPLAIYLDAEAVAAAGGEWAPDPTLYGLLGVAGIVAQPLQVPLAVYYLYRRHEATGVP